MNKERTCIFCGGNSFDSSTCGACGYIRNRVIEFDEISPGEGPIEFESFLKDNGCKQAIPSLAMLSKIMNKVLRGGDGIRPKPGIENHVRDNAYRGLV